MTVLSVQLKKTIDQWVAKFPEGKQRSAVVVALLAAQEENQGWLSEDIMLAVADYLNIPKVEVFEVATFYDMYELKPIGKHKIGLCTNVSCKLRGSDDIEAALSQRLGVKLGQTTEDNLFTLRETECLGACANAPVCQLDNREFYEDLTVDSMLELVDRLEREAQSSHE
jgi:NADH-quinone oxidoreductase subunit E